MAANKATIPGGVPLAGPFYIVDQNGNPISMQSLGTALLVPGNQPTQTAAAAADTVLKFGTDGKATAYHLTMQNNSAADFYYSFDVDSTVSTSPVYVLATGGQYAIWDRTFTQLHCHSASQITFGGTSGLTVEAFAP